MVKWLLYGAAGLFGLACAGAGLLWFLATRGLKEPLQDLPVAEREWGKAALVVRQMSYFEVHGGGRTEYYLVAAAAEPVARCPEARSDAPSHEARVEGRAVSITLRKTLTGGRCGRRGFEGSTLPDDPRRLEVRLPDLESGPVTVEVREGARAARLTLAADAEAVRVSGVDDPTGLLAPRYRAFKRLPRRLYLVLGADVNLPGLWGGSIRVEPVGGEAERGDAVGEVVQYARAPAPYEYAGGRAEVGGREVLYTQGVSEDAPDAVRAAVLAAVKERGGDASQVEVRELRL